MTPAVRSLLLGKPKTPARFAAAFASASSQYLTVADNPTLSTGALDFWIAGWMHFASILPSATFAAKYQDSGSNDEWALFLNTATNQLKLAIFSNGSALSSSVLSSFPALTTGLWYFVIGYRDNVNQQLGISINGGAFDTAASVAAPADRGAPFTLGAVGNPTSYHNGRLAGVVFGKSPPGGIAALAATIRDTLYNAGRGRDPRGLTSAEKNRWGVVFAPDFANLNASTCPELIGGLTLTNTNGVTAAAGPGA